MRSKHVSSQRLYGQLTKVRTPRIMGVRRGGKRAFAPLESQIKDKKFLEILKSAAYFRIIDLILALTVYLPV